MHKLRAALALVAVTIAGLDCGSSREPPSLPDSENIRIVSLAPNLTEVLFELGMGKQIVGVTIHCNYPPQAQEKEKIGDFLHPNLEKIVALRPDLVMAEHWPSSKTIPRLRELHTPVLETTSPKSVAEIYETIRQVGKAVNRAERAEALVADMKIGIENIRQRAARLSYRPSVYTEIDLPSWTIGKRSFVTEALRLCGARNLFEDLERPAMYVSKEEIIARDPEIILSFTVAADQISRRPGWAGIRAVREGRIIDDVDPNLLSRGNHRLVKGMVMLQDRILELWNEF